MGSTYKHLGGKIIKKERKKERTRRRGKKKRKKLARSRYQRKLNSHPPGFKYRNTTY